MFKKLKNLFSKKKTPAEKGSLKDDEAQGNWIEPAESPFGVRLLDLRPITLTMFSTSKDPNVQVMQFLLGKKVIDV